MSLRSLQTQPRPLTDKHVNAESSEVTKLEAFSRIPSLPEFVACEFVDLNSPPYYRGGELAVGFVAGVILRLSNLFVTYLHG